MGYPTIEGVKFMGKLVEERTGGRIRIQMFHSRQLGDEKDTLEQTRFGVIDITRVNTAPLNNLVPETLVVGLPFVFRDTAQMHKVMDGPVGEDIGRATQAHGLVTLCYYDSGARSFYTRGRAVPEPTDLKGMKVRVQQSDMWVALMRAFGANATPLPFGEVYSALLLMAWVILGAAAVGVREGFHMGFETLRDILPGPLRRLCMLASDLTITVFGGALAWYGLELALGVWNATLPTLGLPGTVEYLPITLGGLMMGLFGLERLLSHLITGKPPAGLPEHTLLTDS